MRFAILAALVACSPTLTQDSVVATSGADVRVAGTLPAGVDIDALAADLGPDEFLVVGDPMTGEMATLTSDFRTDGTWSSGAASCPDCAGNCDAGLDRTIRIDLSLVGGAEGAFRTATLESENFSAPTIDFWEPTTGVSDTVDVQGTLGSCSTFTYRFDALRSVELENPTATFSQGGYNVSLLADGNFIEDTTAGGQNNDGWAVLATSGHSAVVETASDTPFYSGGTELVVEMWQSYIDSHLLGCFELYATTASRTEFADGATDIGPDAIWTPVTITSFTSTHGAEAEAVVTGNKVLTTRQGTNERYDLLATTPQTGITGFKIATCDDPSLPTGGPGANSNGNFVLSEFRVFTRGL